ncbi:MAG: DUF2117 family protein [Methanohalobium sp.]
MEKIGLVIHGPEVIDSGWAKLIIDRLSERGCRPIAQIGGSMGKTAVIDAGLENIIDITGCLKPSESMKHLIEIENCDVVCLLNHCKSVENGHIFGSMVISGLNKSDLPIVQIESPGPDGEIIAWTSNSFNYAKYLSKLLNLKMSTPTDSSFQIVKNGSTVKRKVSGVLPGENIFVNGIVIGKAESKDVAIVAENGYITSIDGGAIKEHGLEKLHLYDKRAPVDIENAWIKTGVLRHKSSRISPICNRSTDNRSNRVAVIDHNAENCFKIISDVCMAVTIGDDTTAIAGDILYRFAIPVIGIVDGDLDELNYETSIYPGTCILKLKPGYDDILGKRVVEKIFAGNDIISFDREDLFTKMVISIGGELIESVIQY